MNQCGSPFEIELPLQQPARYCRSAAVDLKGKFVMSRWTILDGVEPGSSEELASRMRIQFVSDAYKSMQSRLDGYRSAAGAIFLAVIAATLTFDTTFVRMFIDPSFLSSIQQHGLKATSFIVAGSGLIVVSVGLVALFILERIARYFSEMTSIIYKIDMANDAWTPNVYMEGIALYPTNFRLRSDGQKNHVGVHQDDRSLIGWRDPAIRSYRTFTIIVTVIHAVYYAILTALLTS